MTLLTHRGEGPGFQYAGQPMHILARHDAGDLRPACQPPAALTWTALTCDRSGSASGPESPEAFAICARAGQLERVVQGVVGVGGPVGAGDGVHYVGPEGVVVVDGHAGVAAGLAGVHVEDGDAVAGAGVVLR